MTEAGYCRVVAVTLRDARQPPAWPCPTQPLSCSATAAAAAPSSAACRLHDLAHNDCPGCCVLSKLSQFYESKTRTQPKKRSSSRR